MLLDSQGRPLGQQPQPIISNFFYTPNAENRHPDFIDFFKRVKKSLRIGMFHWTDLEALEVAIWLHKQGKDVWLMLDRVSVQKDTTGRYTQALKMIADAALPMRLSSLAYTISHWKAAVADEATDSPETLISSINLTDEANVTRDFGITTPDKDIAAEVSMVMRSDWDNYENSQIVSLDLKNPFLVWSPENSAQKKIALIGSASESVRHWVENLGYTDLHNALIAANQKQHAEVRSIVPLYDKNDNPFYNLPFVRTLEAGGVDARMMPGKEATAELCYIHAKAMIIDKLWVFLGSPNDSFNSLRAARELGIIFANADIAQEMSKIHDQDFQRAIVAPSDSDLPPRTAKP